MRDRALAAMLAVLAAGLAAVVVVATRDERELAFTLGVQPLQVAAVLGPGETACQAPVDVQADAAAVRFRVGTFMRAGQPLRVRAAASGATAATRVPGGYADGADVKAPLGIEAERRVAVCIANAGRRRVALYGGAAQAAPTSLLEVDGRRQGTDLTLTFVRAEPRSMLAMVPTVFERASLFHFSWAGSWLYWGLLAAVSIAAPVLLVLGLRATDERRSR